MVLRDNIIIIDDYDNGRARTCFFCVVASCDYSGSEIWAGCWLMVMIALGGRVSLPTTQPTYNILPCPEVPYRASVPPAALRAVPRASAGTQRLREGWKKDGNVALPASLCADRDGWAGRRAGR